VESSMQEMIYAKIEFVRRTGMRVLQVRRGKVICKMPLCGNENHRDCVYAGALFTLADITGGLLLLATFDAKQFFPILKDIQLDFIKPATTDICLSCQISDRKIAMMQAEAGRDGKASLVLEAPLTDRSGEIVATSRGTFQIRSL